MDIAAMIADIRSRPDFGRAGMVLAHNRVVRETARDRRRVKGLRVRVDHGRLQRLLSERRGRPGIVDIRVAIAEDRDLAVGEDGMVLVVAGDIRENVIAVLGDTLNRIKATVTAKTEYYEV